MRNKAENDGSTVSSNTNQNDSSQTSRMHNAYQKTMTALGVARDGIAIGVPTVSASFDAANASVDAGFAMSHRAITSSLRAASFLGLIDGEKAGTAQQSVRNVVDAAHCITKGSLGASATITKASLKASDIILSATGAQQGETLRLLSKRVASQEGDKRDMGNALIGLISLLAKVGGYHLSNNPLALMPAARSLAALHEEQRRERIRRRHESSTFRLRVPLSSDMLSLSKHMRYAAAAYGLIGMGNCWSRYGKGQVPWMCDEDVIQDLTGLNRSDIICINPGEGIYQPAHFVAIDHKDKEVIVAIRGTMSIQDVLVDLVCQTENFTSVPEDEEDEMVVEGKAHEGFLKSAQRLAGKLHEPVVEALSNNPEYRLVVVGHSLGAGVATLLTLLWARIPVFRARDIHGYSYASPCCVCESISQAPFTRRHVTSVVFGDDLVSRLSLATFRELQRDIANISIKNNESSNQTTDADDEEKLYCAGKVWWLESNEYKPHPIVEIDPVEDLHHIELFSDMLTTHLPWAYLDALEKLDTHSDSGTENPI
uniref:sn-1-specific diacylglycerol lipase n=1 Tax=Ditylum brightwellii TaxID=49249 RepID=A0A7S4S8V7_9STRA